MDTASEWSYSWLPIPAAKNWPIRCSVLLRGSGLWGIVQYCILERVWHIRCHAVNVVSSVWWDPHAVLLPLWRGSLHLLISRQGGREPVSFGSLPARHSCRGSFIDRWEWGNHVDIGEQLHGCYSLAGQTSCGVWPTRLDVHMIERKMFASQESELATTSLPCRCSNLSTSAQHCSMRFNNVPPTANLNDTKPVL